MKRLFLLILLTVFLISFSLVWFYKNTKPVSSDKTFTNFLIAKRSSASLVGNKLQGAGLIKNATVFKIYLRLTGQAGKIQTGEFRLSPSFSLFQVVDQLSRGPIEIWVTVPEGLRREEIAAKFATNLDRDQTFVNDFLASSKGQEGYLFPETYLFPKDASASAIVAKMIKTYESRTKDLSPINTNLSKSEIITLASIIERETKTDEERPIVAGILMNRLSIGMALQVDATLQFAIANLNYKFQITNPTYKWWEQITKNDLNINSPYNTYKFTGLPPGPIANPGSTSIMAAFAPSPSDYWYYIHDDKGKIHYAKTLAEHNQNIRTYLGK